ncbi:MAG TPA: Ig-like domain-containing protein [Gemmatimonadales bacterium]|nr:Ig-like domain-containing protein [Gemmatimonadales bacterium]
MSQRRAIVSLLILLAACGGGDSSGPGGGPDPVATVLVTPNTGTLMVGTTVQLSVALKSAASVVLTGRPVRWRSSDDNSATVTATGLVTAKLPGSVTITASSEGQSGSATLNIIPVPVATVTVVPSSASLGAGTSSQLSAVTKDASGGVLTGRVVTWLSSNPQSVSVSGTGLLTAGSPGSATITATSEGISGFATITVDPTPVASVSVSPSTASVGVAATTQLNATTKDASNNVLPGRVVAWFSSAPGVAQVDPNGVVTGVTMGQATITAISEGKTGSALVTVVAGAAATITVSPSPAAVNAEDSVQLSAQVKDAAGDLLSGQTITWMSLTPSVASVDGSGMVNGISAGTALITATSGSLSATDTVEVAPAAVALVTLTVPSTHLGVGSTLQLSATPRDAHGAALSGRVVTWSSSDSSIATVASTGLVTGVTTGSVTITAASGGKTASTSIVVEIEAVATVIVSPGTQSVGAGLDVQMSAVTLSSAGDTLPGRAITWNSSAPSVATVDGSGLVAGVSAGSTTITATSEGIDGTASVTVVVTLAFPALDGGYAHTCSLTAGGDAYCWGLNVDGELGTGTTSASSAVPILVSGGVSFASLYPGGKHTCALTSGGTVYCWGSNLQGQLGQGNNTNSSVPLQVAGFQFTALTGGFSHVCGLTAAGKAYCWGSNSQGELGDGTTTGRNSPVPVSGGKTFVELSARGTHTCGLTAGGSAFCWGRNTNGELGDGTTSNRTSPVAVGGGLSFVELTTGAGHTCGLTSGGAAYCWGDNSVFEIGDGTTTDQLTPVAVLGGLSFQTLKARGTHTCGVTTSGEAYCWGENIGGELGDGTTTNRSSPVAVLGGLGFANVSSGATFSCGITSSSVLYCWGDNSTGQLGDGTFASSSVPVKVLGQP